MGILPCGDASRLFRFHMINLSRYYYNTKMCILINNTWFSYTFGGITVTFTSKPGINEVITLVHDKLPAFYNQAFSIHLANAYGGFDNAKVTEIEWPGSKINPEKVKKVFPLAKINLHYGKAFLVYKNGQRELL